MEREIKFEVIITDNKKELYCKFYEWLDGDEWKHSYYNPLVMNGVFRIEELGDGWMGEIIRRQYTEIKDRNLNEVYEKDIIIDKYTGLKYLIEFGQVPKLNINGRYGVNEELNKHCIFSGDYRSNINNNVEVIGNIYENPELLNNESK